ncbi:MAG: hypothetical protein A2V52_01070 [Actinobacteria bacterium RBG_19FT_COMBO_54_7]|uniref:Type I restriction enzyme R protein N-terminal domain-containing protein n=1 Tax=Candidatus Solincola sediminis TaxID=1797199 RepID=A0A1F2WK37_9ACTN|nr:MAG: hypothetical protein A2W01_12600 [Candidatus Solincola sediminis]OFW57230.1 MAG: hypothetical protein A2Y75_07305 [Candidatus Solincola sediminis]OFW65323.1 MAG: hypothetical protein A2V52_01070 [Actinobacteria bacterium RBG_19FT_COMBO_54_7]
MARESTTIPKRVSERLAKELRKFQPIVSSALARDINEADTVIIIKDILAYVLGYDKYEEITSEHQIRGQYCDLAIVVGGKLEILLEVKAIGMDLKGAHTRQAVNYAANQGTEWVVLTNGAKWQIYHIHFAQPITEELICEFNFLDLDPKKPNDLECLYILTRDGLHKSALDDYHSQKEALSKFNLAAIILSEPILKAIRRDLKVIAPEVKIDLPEIEAILKQEVLKREIVEGEKAEATRRTVRKVFEKQARTKQKKKVIREPLIEQPEIQGIPETTTPAVTPDVSESGDSQILI